MSNLRPKDLSKIGYTNDKARSIAIAVISKHYKHSSREEITELLAALLQNPAAFASHEYLQPLAEVFTGKPGRDEFRSYTLKDETGPLKIYGARGIEASARKQMETAMSLPVVISGALMPDAHTGYGLPIGGVIAAENALIPYAVGMDIGCRMALTVFAEGAAYNRRFSYQIKEALKTYTHFCMEGSLENRPEHEITDDKRFASTELLRRLQHKAARQLGTSGNGNHFVEFGTVELFTGNSLGLAPGNYMALLSHSGSRGLGANIAQHYTQIAMHQCRLPKHVRSLAWLSLDTWAGMEYHMAMNLAGDYARACHQVIHAGLSKALGLTPLALVENHHNFAWEEELNGKKVFVHRKGATPAHEGELGIIPGSMTTAAYLVRGKGIPESLNSASHGAGRAMSRQRARENMTQSALKKMLSAAGVTLIGGSTEENPMAYKDIETVMAAQTELVYTEGRFLPSVVRMNRE